MEKLAVDLKPGDKYLEQRLGKTHVITILKEAVPMPNQFDLRWFRFWATNGEREGYVSFGRKGKVTLA